MKSATIVMILFSVTLTASAQILLKFGMVDRRIGSLSSFGDILAIIMAIATSPWIIGGLLMFGISVVVWLFVLASVPLSVAYPFVALGICVTSLAGNIVFSEPFTPMKMFGLAFIVLGIALISASVNEY